MSSPAAPTNAPTVENLVTEFQAHFKGSPQIFRAPGRVNLIGEHTDYNDGFVMPAAINLAMWVAAAPGEPGTLRVYSRQLDETAEVKLDSLAGGPTGHWTDFVRGVASGLIAAGCDVKGANLLIDGHVPLGSGLSSSAALELSLATALLDISGCTLPKIDIVKLSQKAEHNFVGTRCGIMDQFISAFGQEGHAIVLDCRTLDYTPVPLPKGLQIVICNTMVKHELASGEYNRRREACEHGVKIMQQFATNVRALRDVTIAQLEQHKDAFPEIVYRRCRHVVAENARVHDFAEALRTGALDRCRELMLASHVSLRDDYEVSCPELDAMVDAALQSEGIVGARMTGGGFGGCTVNLVKEVSVEKFTNQVSKRYHEATGLTPAIYVASAASGAGKVS